MLLAAVLVNAFHAALEDRIVTLDRDGVDRLRVQPVELVNPELVAHVFLLAVVHSLMARIFAADCWVPFRLVGHERVLAIDVRAHDLTQSCGGGPVMWKLRAEPPRSTRVKTMLRY